MAWSSRAGKVEVRKQFPPSREASVLDRDTIQALRKASQVALNAFVDQANRTRAKFDDFERLSAVSQEYLQEILEQRIVENEAFERYQRTRYALFDMARQGNVVWEPR